MTMTPFDTAKWQTNFDKKWRTLDDAANVIQSGDRVWIGGANCVATPVLQKLCLRKEELKDVELFGGLLMFPFDFLKPDFKGHIHYTAIFAGPLERKLSGPGSNISINSLNFSQFNNFLTDTMKPNVLLLEVSRPNEQGLMSLGQTGALMDSKAVEMADTIVAVVNEEIPFLPGSERCFLHVDQATMIVECNHELPYAPQATPSELEESIASHILPHINDGDVIQVGFGGISDAVAYKLDSKKNLKIHSEIMADSMLYLVEQGSIDPESTITYSLAVGSRKVLDFLNGNEKTRVMPLVEVVDPATVGAYDNFVSINGALMADLTGQIASEGVGLKQISCTGGQLDFVRGAGLSKGGRSFLALSSSFEGKNGLESRIRLTLPEGTPVTTPRSDVMYIVTEYGVADIRNKPIKDRVKAMIAIAHPDFREELTTRAKAAGLMD